MKGYIFVFFFLNKSKGLTMQINFHSRLCSYLPSVPIFLACVCVYIYVCVYIVYIYRYIHVPVAQWLEHCVSSAGCGFDSQETHTDNTCIA